MNSKNLDWQASPIAPATIWVFLPLPFEDQVLGGWEVMEV